jgi:glycogen synthase
MLQIHFQGWMMTGHILAEARESLRKMLSVKVRYEIHSVFYFYFFPVITFIEIGWSFTFFVFTTKVFLATVCIELFQMIRTQRMMMLLLLWM